MTNHSQQTPSQRAAAALSEAQAALLRLQQEKEQMRRQVGYDYGPDAEWLFLRNT